MLNEIRYYEESGGLSPVKLIASYLLVVLMAVILGYVYSMLSNLIPFVYINALVAAACGYAVYLAVSTIGKLTKNRHERSNLLLTIIGSLAVLYFAWVAFILNCFSEETVDPMTYLAALPSFLNPMNLWEPMKVINSIGTWGISGDSAVNGMFLSVIWLIEAAVILGLPILSMFGRDVDPFSEEQNKWYGNFALNHLFNGNFSETESFIADFNNDPVNHLQSSEPGISQYFTQAILHYLPGEHDQYISFNTITLDDEGDADSNQFVSNLRISTEAAEELMQTYDSTKL